MGTGSAVAAAARDVSKQLAELGQGGRDPFEALDGAGWTSWLGRGPSPCPAARSSTRMAPERRTPSVPGA